MHVLNTMMHYDYDLFSKNTTLIEVNNDECMKTNTYILLSVTYERYIGLCHKDNLKIENYMDLMHCVYIYIEILPHL